MSVLSFPRINFTGYMCWDPATGNNNDYFPTYDDVRATLNWDFFKQFGIDITPDNFGRTFRPWAIDNQTIGFPGNGQSTTGIPGEWNYFGGNAAYFVQYTDPAGGIDRRTLVTGGMLGPGQPVAGDPLIGTPVTLLGDPFGDPEPKPPGRLVDNNPVSVYTSQIYYNGVRAGSEAASIAAPRAYRMQSRFINFTRNFNLTAAGGASVTWQACFPAGPTLAIKAGQSQLLAALQAAIALGKAKGIMLRFNTYLNLYFQNGCFNGFQPQPKSVDELPALYKAALASGNLFSNPCYSRIVGVIGLWSDDELATCPEGRYLVAPPSIYLCNPRAAAPCWSTAPATVAPLKAAHPAAGQASGGAAGPINVPPASLKPAAQLGVAVAQVDEQRNLLSIDLLNTFPEWYWQGDKVDFKEIAVGVVNAAGAFTQVATIPYASYAQAGYERGGGIVDLPISPQQAQLLRDGLIAFQVQPSVWVAEVDGAGQLQPSPTRVVLVEQPFTAQTDQRSTYLNEGERATLAVSVRHKGRPAAGANLLVVKYNPPPALVGPVDAVPVKLPQVVNMLSGLATVITATTDSGQSVQTNAAILTADKNGTATLAVEAASPGFPVLVFYPYLPGASPPVAPGSFDEVGTAMFATVRVLSYDDAFVDRFVQLWNSSFDPARAWDFVYSNILYLYDMLFPVMLKFVPLGDRQRVEGAIDQVLALIAPSYFAESTLAMPITRDLSRGKRAVLQLWGGLVKKNYPPQPITRPELASV